MYTDLRYCPNMVATIESLGYNIDEMTDEDFEEAVKQASLDTSGISPDEMDEDFETMLTTD